MDGVNSVQNTAHNATKVAVILDSVIMDSKMLMTVLVR